MQQRSRHRPSFLPLSPDRTFAVLVALLVLVALTGGGSRHDIESLAILRPLAALAAAVGLMGLRGPMLRAYRVPFLLLGALAAIMAVQLIPLPPSLWTHLPSRGAIHALDAAVGLADVWRPITLSPMKTANALAALVVPFAVLVLFVQLGEARKRQILLVLVALAAVGAVIGVFQALAGSDSGLYFYAVTHKGAAVGLFANRNHHTAFMAVAMLIALHLATERGRPAGDTVSVACLAAAALLFVGVLGNISRAGLLSAGVALVLVPLVISTRAAPGGEGGRLRWLRSRWFAGALFALPAVGLFLLFAVTQRSPALSRLLSDATVEDLRGQVLPVLLSMTRDFQPLGTGFGAFEYAYRMREPAELLVPNYLNNAHNDWLQFAIEGGAGALLAGAAVMAAIAVRAIRLWRRAGQGGPRVSRAWLGLAILLVLGFASLFDYPLRVPTIMAVAIIALALLLGPVLEQTDRKACPPG